MNIEAHEFPIEFRNITIKCLKLLEETVSDTGAWDIDKLTTEMVEKFQEMVEQDVAQWPEEVVRKTTVATIVNAMGELMLSIIAKAIKRPDPGEYICKVVADAAEKMKVE